MRDITALTLAFTDLERRGVLTFQNFWCCGGCSGGGVAQAHEANPADIRSRTVGAVWYHEQDAEYALDGYGLDLLYDSLPSGERQAEIGGLLVEALRARGFAPEWDGDPASVVTIPKFAVQLHEIPKGEGSRLHETYGADEDDDMGYGDMGDYEDEEEV